MLPRIRALHLQGVRSPSSRLRQGSLFETRGPWIPGRSDPRGLPWDGGLPLDRRDREAFPAGRRTARQRTRRGGRVNTIFEKSVAGRRASSIPIAGVDTPDLADIPDHLLRTKSPKLPEVSELDLVRHYTNLSRMNWAIDVGPYPLGSCTMKYNPKIHEQTAALEGFRGL